MYQDEYINLYLEDIVNLELIKGDDNKNVKQLE